MPNCTINGFFYAGFFYENQSDWPNSIIMFRRCLEID